MYTAIFFYNILIHFFPKADCNPFNSLHHALQCEKHWVSVSRGSGVVTADTVKKWEMFK